MEKPAAPCPLLQIAIEAKPRADEEKLRVALSTLANEDLSFRVKTDEESGQTIISGTGELHLDIIIDRLRREFDVAVNVGAPQVAYRETITRKHEQDYTLKRLFAGQGQFARVKVLFEPNGHNPDFAFVSRVPDGAFPGDYAAAVEKGVRSILVSGPYAGFPMIGIKATLVDAARHHADSPTSAFEIAGSACFKEAAPQLGVQLLEPIMKVEVVTPEDYVGRLIGDLNGRRGQIQGQKACGVVVVINAVVPLANMPKYVDNLRSMSQGRATYTMRFDHYAPVPRPDRDPPPPAVAAYA